MENEKVYAIIQGCYSDQEVIGVCFDEELAKAYAEVKGTKGTYNECFIEEVPIITDKNFIDLSKRLVVVHEYKYELKNGSLILLFTHTYKESADIKTEHVTVEDDKYIPRTIYTVRVWGDHSEDEAKKIALDKLCKYRAEQMNL